MSTLALDEKAVAHIGQVLISLEYSGKSSATAGLYGGLSTALYDNAMTDFFLSDLIYKTLRVAYSMNQHCYNLRYKDRGFFKLGTFTSVKHEPTKKEMTQAYKNLQCLRYNLDKYLENKRVVKALDAIKDVFVTALIEESEVYNVCKWGEL